MLSKYPKLIWSWAFHVEDEGIWKVLLHNPYQVKKFISAPKEYSIFRGKESE